MKKRKKSQSDARVQKRQIEHWRIEKKDSSRKQAIAIALNRDGNTKMGNAEKLANFYEVGYYSKKTEKHQRIVYF